MARQPRDELQARFRRQLDAELQRRDLATWMRAHRAEVEALLAEGEMDWANAAARLAGAGMLVDGQPPTAETAEATWRRVRR